MRIKNVEGIRERKEEKEFKKLQERKEKKGWRERERGAYKLL